ncbi:unnamed protein product [Sphagnum jensenii]
MAAMAPGTVESKAFAWNQMLTKCVKDGQPEKLIQSGCESDVLVGSSSVDMYAKSGSIEDASRVFNKMPYSQDVVTWTAIILGHVQSRQGQKALELF